MIQTGFSVVVAVDPDGNIGGRHRIIGKNICPEPTGRDHTLILFVISSLLLNLFSSDSKHFTSAVRVSTAVIVSPRVTPGRRNPQRSPHSTKVFKSLPANPTRFVTNIRLATGVNPICTSWYLTTH